MDVRLESSLEKKAVMKDWNARTNAHTQCSQNNVSRGG